MNCKVCKSENTNIIFHNDIKVPIISNFVFQDAETAKKTPHTVFKIFHCNNCDFVFESSKKDTIFDEFYDNTQQNSLEYIEYINEICTDICKIVSKDEIVVEIGCGNGYLVEQLNKEGVECYGFDPSYSGSDVRIKNRYYTQKNTSFTPSLIVLRHVLDYPRHPIDFLHNIAKMHKYNSQFYIEVPSYDFIKENNYWIDFNGERYSYFSKSFFQNLFSKSIIKETFDGQYLTVIADMKNMRDLKGVKLNGKISNVDLTHSFKKSKKVVSKLQNVALWGASGRGVIFANLMDNKTKIIKCLIDINTNKIGKFIGGGYEVIGIEDIAYKGIENIIIMNSIYEKEIRTVLKEKKLDINIILMNQILHKG